MSRVVDVGDVAKVTAVAEDAHGSRVFSSTHVDWGQDRAVTGFHQTQKRPR